MGGPQKPGETYKVKCVGNIQGSVEFSSHDISLELSDVADAEYFQVGKYYVVSFIPAPDDVDSVGGNSPKAK